MISKTDNNLSSFLPVYVQRPCLGLGPGHSPNKPEKFSGYLIMNFQQKASNCLGSEYWGWYWSVRIRVGYGFPP